MLMKLTNVMHAFPKQLFLLITDTVVALWIPLAFSTTDANFM